MRKISNFLQTTKGVAGGYAVECEELGYGTGQVEMSVGILRKLNTDLSRVSGFLPRTFSLHLL
jgi:hypothetical protein